LEIKSGVEVFRNNYAAALHPESFREQRSGISGEKLKVGLERLKEKLVLKKKGRD
jgi:hypothetical protein